MDPTPPAPCAALSAVLIARIPAKERAAAARLECVCENRDQVHPPVGFNT